MNQLKKIICHIKGHEPPEEDEDKLSLNKLVIWTRCIRCRRCITIEQSMEDEDAYLVSEREEDLMDIGT